MAATHQQLLAAVAGTQVLLYDNRVLQNDQLQTLETALADYLVANSAQYAGAALTAAHAQSGVVNYLILLANVGASPDLVFPEDHTFRYCPDAAAPNQIHNTLIPLNSLLAIVMAHTERHPRRWLQSRSYTLYRLGIAHDINWDFGRKGGLPHELRHFGFDGVATLDAKYLNHEARLALDAARQISLKRASAKYFNDTSDSEVTAWSP